MSDILDEVTVDWVEERKLLFFKRLLPIAAGVTVLIVMFMIWYNHHNSKITLQNQETSDLFVQAMDARNSDPKTYNEVLDSLMRDNGTGISDLAGLEKVHSYMESGDSASALEKLATLANNATNNLTREYSKIVWMAIIIDTKDISDSEKRRFEDLDKYFSDKNKPFFCYAALLRAMFNIKNDNKNEARAILQELVANDKASQLIKDQARAILANLNL